MFFLAACGMYNTTASTACPLSEIDEPWAALGDVDFYGSNPTLWAGAESVIRSMVDSNFIVNTNVCPDTDTAWCVEIPARSANLDIFEVDLSPHSKSC
jgi:hypothetical protein